MMMIKSFNSQRAEDIYHGINSKHARKIPMQIHKVAIRKLDQLNAATKIETLNVPPNNRLEQLKGRLTGFWSIRINNQYRIIFAWDNGNAYKVDIVDYH